MTPIIPLSLLLTPILLTLFTPSIIPLSILRLTPLISSTIFLTWAYDEYAFLTAWLLLPKTERMQIQHLLPLWFAKWGSLGTRVLFTSFPLGLGSGIANTISLSRSSSHASTVDGGGVNVGMWLYVAGSFFTLMHFAYGPKAMGLLKRIRMRKEEAGSDSLGSLKLWMAMHLQRCWVADGPAWVAFVAAAWVALEVR